MDPFVILTAVQIVKEMVVFKAMAPVIMDAKMAILEVTVFRHVVITVRTLCAALNLEHVTRDVSLAIMAVGAIYHVFHVEILSVIKIMGRALPDASLVHMALNVTQIAVETASHRRMKPTTSTVNSKREGVQMDVCRARMAKPAPSLAVIPVLVAHVTR